MRRVIVASGTRNARAISAVVRPPTARRVSAICDAGDSDGWQHRNSRTSVSSDVGRGRSAAGASQCSGSAQRATVSSRRRRACSLRSRSVSRRDGDRDQPGPRVVRDAVARPLRRRPRAAPPARRPRRCRSARSGARPRRGPAAPAGAAGPRRRVAVTARSELQLVRGRRRSAGCRRTLGATRAPGSGTAPAGRRSRWPGRSCRTRRSCSRPAPPGSRRTGPSVTTGTPSCSWTRRACTGAARPRASTNSPDSTSSLLHASMNSCIAANSSGDQRRLVGRPCRPCAS